MTKTELLKIYNIVNQYKSGERNFTGINLNEVNLSRIRLSQANLSRASFMVANLSSADLSFANLTGANLNVARLSSTNLTQAILDEATINVANLVRADLSYASLVNTLAIRSEFIQAQLYGANLTRANLNGADLRESKLELANFTEANLSAANLRGASGIGVNFEKADLRGATLTKVDLQKANFTNAELRQTNFTYANLSGADLAGANLRWADLRGANLRGTNLSDANLSGANLTGADLSNANLLKTSLVHADLTQANLIRVDWIGADLSRATLTGAKLYDVPRFSLKAEEVKCEWVDLSPNGDHSQIYRFNRETLKRFFNQTLPLVQIIVDSPLDLQANVILATLYYQISQEYPALSRPPSIVADHRKTTITFRVDSEEYLFPIACMAVFPFYDASITQKNIMAIVRQIQDKKMNRERRIQVLTAMNQVISKANDIKKIVKSFQPESSGDFFQFPTQTRLQNSNQKTLIIYSHVNFGKRVHHLENLESEPSEITDTRQSPLPNIDEIIDFIESFDYLK